MRINYTDKLNSTGVFWEKDLDSENDLLIQVDWKNGILYPKVSLVYNNRTKESRYEYYDIVGKSIRTLVRTDLDKKNINSFIKNENGESKIDLGIPWTSIIGCNLKSSRSSYLEVESPIDIPDDYFNVDDFTVYYFNNVYYIVDERYINEYGPIGICSDGVLSLNVKDEMNDFMNISMLFDKGNEITFIDKVLSSFSKIGDFYGSWSSKLINVIGLLNKNNVSILSSSSTCNINYVKLHGNNIKIKQSINTEDFM